MGIKIGRAEFSKHEFALLLVCLCFFSLIFFGSFGFGLMGKIFPLLIGGPGLLLVVLYLISGFLPPQFHESMKKDTDFRLFGLIPEQGAVQPDSSENDPPLRPKAVFDIHLSYLVLALFAGFVLFSYLFGFYISTFLFAFGYLFLFARKDAEKLSNFSKLLLLCLLLGAVFVFDYSFGYNFMEGAVFELFGWVQ